MSHSIRQIVVAKTQSFGVTVSLRSLPFGATLCVCVCTLYECLHPLIFFFVFPLMRSVILWHEYLMTVGLFDRGIKWRFFLTYTRKRPRIMLVFFPVSTILIGFCKHLKHIWFSFQLVLQQLDNDLSKKLNDAIYAIRLQRCSYLRYKIIISSFHSWSFNHLLLTMWRLNFFMQFEIMQKAWSIRLVDNDFC